MTSKFKGHFGWAERAKFGADAALVDLWFLHLPNQAIGNAWSEFMIGVIHLREMKGIHPPHITKPGNTHELQVLSLQTGQCPTTPLPWKFLTPANVVVQFRVPSDLHASRIAELAALACVNGELMAESSIFMLEGPNKGRMMILAAVVEQWEEAIALTAQHYETGGHHGTAN